MKKQKLSGRKIQIVLDIYMTVVLFFLALSFSTVLVLLMKPLYSLACSWFHIPARAGVTKEVCVRNFSALLDYNLSFGNKELALLDFPLSKYGRIHFQEVRQIFHFLIIALPVSFFLFLGGLWLSEKEKYVGYMKKAIVFTICVIVMVVTFFAIDSRTAFIVFHKIFFRNGYWLFSPTRDPIITTLPTEVFLLYGGVAFVFMASVLAGISFLCRYLKRKWENG